MIAGTKKTGQDIDAQVPGILKRVESGERSAFDTIVKLYWSTVLSFLWKRVPAADAEDLAQDAFLALYKAIRKGLAGELTGPDALRRYLLACARSRAVDHYRRKRIEEPVGALEDLLCEESANATGGAAEESNDPLVSDEEKTAVRDCLGQLDVSSRSVCWLHFVDGKSKREIAASLSMPESSFRVLFSRVLADLKNCLEAKGVV